MKTLQNDLTTIEQSKRLLELGVPKNSANHYYGKDGKIHYIDGTIPYSLLWETGCIPCWSVGRLMEIVDIASAGNNHLSQNWDNTLSAKETSGSYVNYIVEYIVDNIAQLNFLKLED